MPIVVYSKIIFTRCESSINCKKMVKDASEKCHLSA